MRVYANGFQGGYTVILLLHTFGNAGRHVSVYIYIYEYASCVDISVQGSGFRFVVYIEVIGGGYLRVITW